MGLGRGLDLGRVVLLHVPSITGIPRVSSTLTMVAVKSLEMFEVMNSQDLSLVTYISYCRMLRIQMSAAILDRPSNSIVL